MAQSLLTLIFTGLLLLAQTLGIQTGTERKTVDDLISAFHDLRASFLEEPGAKSDAGNAGTAPESPGAQDGRAAGDQPAAARVERRVLGAGESWETAYYVIDSGRSGPVVMVVAGLHGDEPAALLAAERLIEQAGEITAGQVVLLPEANAPAVRARKAHTGADLNRAFPVETVRGEAPAPQEPAAAAIWQLVEQHRPDWLVDLHDESSDVTGQTVVYHEAQPEAAWAAQAMAGHLNEALDEADTAFRTAGGLPSGSLARAAAELFDARALVVETHRRHSLAARSEWLADGVMYLLAYLGMR